jgi:hypothetical protein
MSLFSCPGQLAFLLSVVLQLAAAASQAQSPKNLILFVPMVYGPDASMPISRRR